MIERYLLLTCFFGTYKHARSLQQKWQELSFQIDFFAIIKTGAGLVTICFGGSSAVSGTYTQWQFQLASHGFHEPPVAPHILPVWLALGAGGFD